MTYILNIISLYRIPQLEHIYFVKKKLIYIEYSYPSERSAMRDWHYIVTDLDSESTGSLA